VVEPCFCFQVCYPEPACAPNAFIPQAHNPNHIGKEREARRPADADAEAICTRPHQSLRWRRSEVFLKHDHYEALARETSNIGLWLRAIFEIYYGYGWRKNEPLKNMRVRMLDFEHRTITIDDSKNGDDAEGLRTA
jgi:hypothetical protein